MEELKPMLGTWSSSREEGGTYGAVQPPDLILMLLQQPRLLVRPLRRLKDPHHRIRPAREDQPARKESGGEKDGARQLELVGQLRAQGGEGDSDRNSRSIVGKGQTSKTTGVGRDERRLVRGHRGARDKVGTEGRRS